MFELIFGIIIGVIATIVYYDFHSRETAIVTVVESDADKVETAIKNDV